MLLIILSYEHKDLKKCHECIYNNTSFGSVNVARMCEISATQKSKVASSVIFPFCFFFKSKPQIVLNKIYFPTVKNTKLHPETRKRTKSFHFSSCDFTVRHVSAPSSKRMLPD